jgi:hypothetical protein
VKTAINVRVPKIMGISWVSEGVSASEEILCSVGQGPGNGN